MSRLRGPVTLTARLVAVVVLLVAATAAVIATATTLAMREELTDRLDDDLRTALGRVDAGPPGRGPRGGPDHGAETMLGQRFGTVTAELDGSGTGSGLVLAEQEGESWAAWVPLSDAQLGAVADVPPGRLATVRIPALGSYRVGASDRPDGGRQLVGLPLAEVDETVGGLAALELVATLVSVSLAAAAAVVVVRRQLAPLREVAATAHRVSELPLAAGDIDLDERVPARLADDRTEVGRVGHALNRMLDHVEASLAARHRSEQQVRQFVADASHELRTPLATIAGYSELARRRPETTPTALAKVEAECERMTTLVEDLLLLARLDQGRPLAREHVDLSLVLLEAVNDARVVDRERRWQVSLPTEPLMVIGDGSRLHQVVSNLLTNARVHTPPGTTVTVTGRADGFDVHDDGPGFAPDVTDRAFERFARGDAARRRTGGAGLGLSLVEAIVQAHGGSVALASEPGSTTVSVRLPAAGQDPVTDA